MPTARHINAPPRQAIDGLWLMAFYILPVVLHRYFQASSFAAGLLLSALIILTSATLIKRKLKFNSLDIVALILTTTYLLLISIASILKYPNHDTLKSLITILTIPLLIFASTLIQRNANITAFEQIFKLILALQVLSIPLHYLGFFSGTAMEKSSLLFNEPSHFAIVITPLAIISIFQTPKLWHRIVYMVALSTIALYFKNLILLVSIAICSLVVTFMMRKLSFKLFASVASMFIVFAISQLQSDYLLGRLDFGSQDNASVLTLLSAYERLYLTLKDETVFGVGIQGFGTNSPTGSYFSMLSAVDDRASLIDSGVTFAKFGAELGIFTAPIFFIAAYATIKVFASNKIPVERKAVFFGFSVGFFIEFFLRGVGYYSINFITYMSLILISITSTSKLRICTNPFACNIVDDKNRAITSQ